MLSRWLVLGLVVLIASPSAAAMAPCPPSAPCPDAQPAAAGTTVIEVDSLLKAPEKYPGTIRVRGMVRKVFLEEKRLGLLDASCACASSGSLLPVIWTGDMPRVRALVLVTGETKKTGGAFEFVAKSLEILPTPPLVAK
jgi:hypothetical protein